MTGDNNGDMDPAALLGIQAIFVMYSIGLLISWILQFNRVTGRNVEKIPTIELSSIVFAGMTIFIGFFTSADPFSDLNLLDSRILVVCQLAETGFAALWGLANGIFNTKLILVVVGKKLKESGSDHIDNFDIVQYAVGVFWGLFGIIAGGLVFMDDTALIPWFVWILVIGVLGSFASLTVGGVRASEKYTPLNPDTEEMKISARRKITANLMQLGAFHIAVMALLIFDIALGIPVGDSSHEVDVRLESFLIISGLVTRGLVSYELWYHWLDKNEKDYMSRLENRRKDYKVVSVERRIDERIQREQKLMERGAKTVIDSEYLQKTTVYTEDEYDVVETRGRGQTDAHIEAEVQRMMKGKRGKDGKEDIPMDTYGKHLDV